MRIQFRGADRTVTGSSHLLEINGLRVLLDCGMYQGRRDEARRLNEIVPDDPQSIDAVILSHGHFDHSGKLPVLVKAGFRGPIYVTAGTAEVARVILEDAAGIQEEDAEYLNRRSRNPADPPIAPLYRRGDIPLTTRLFKRVEYAQKIALSPDVSFTFFDAGHILGSTYIWIEFRESGGMKKLLFTADIGRYGSPILKDAQPPPAAADYVITESTYGAKTHAPMSEVGPQFLDCINYCVQRKSRLLVPSFAVGRTQTMLWYCAKYMAEGKMPRIPVYVDSPMGVEVSKVYCDNTENYDSETLKLFPTKDLFCLSHITFASSSQDSRKINNDRGPCVIIASSPTCEFGRILHHLTQSVENVNDLIVFTGWIPPQTLGRRLQDGEKHVRIYDRWFDVRCGVRTIHGLSAHADGDELMRFLQPALSPTTKCYVVHGEVEQAEGFAAKLMAKGVNAATIPAMETSIVTSADAWERKPVNPQLARTDGD